MQAEQIEIKRFLEQYPPFDELPDSAMRELAQTVEVSYFCAGTDILQYGDPINDLFVVRSGAVETYRRNGDLYNRLDKGGIFGQMGLMMQGKVRFPVRSLEDSLLYCIPADLFNRYCDQFEPFSDYFEAENNALLRQAVSSHADSNDLTTVKVKALLGRDVITVSKDTSIRDAAMTMTEMQVSALLITDPDKPVSDDPEEDDGQLVGIITDRDFRERVLAVGLDPNAAIASVMSTEMVMIDDNAYVYEAMLTMLRYNVHHLPILKKKRAVGVLALSDILQYESQSSLLLVRGIFTQQNVSELAAMAEQIPAAFVRMVNEDANAHMIGTAMSVIGRSIKQRLLELAEQELGPPPVPYCFLALGSMARDEQLIVTDQDNAMILDERYDPDLHGEYFEQLAQYVCDGLAACGYLYCTGKIMATNPQWRLTLSQWKQQFSDWIENPQPQALLNSSIFFDLEGVWGRESWAQELRRHIARHARNNSRFLACLARNALNRTPPLGFFKAFVMEQDGEHKNSINLKRRGTAPLADAIRVHALAVGSRARNSFERLDDILSAGILPDGKAQDLRDALEYIYMVRIAHQARDIERGEAADNNIEPDNLSSFERRNLKEAFQVLSGAQNFLKYRYVASGSISRGKVR